MTKNIELKYQHRPVASIAALKAINTTDIVTGIIVTVGSLYHYIFNKTSITTSDDFNVVQPTTGGGRWFLMGNSIGGYRSVTDIPARDAIPEQVRQIGMTVWVQSEQLAYTLTTGITNADWIVTSLDLSASYITGFTDIADFIIDFNDGSRTLTLTPTGSSFSFYCQGTRFDKTTPQSVIIDDLEGLFLFSFNDLGVLTFYHNPTDTDITDKYRTEAVIGRGYWDFVNKKLVFLHQETQEIQGNAYTSAFVNDGLGTLLRGGAALNSLIVNGDGSSDDQVRYGINPGSIYNGLFNIEIPDLSVGQGRPVFYFEGSPAKLRVQININFPIINTGSGRLAYNLYSGGTWSLVEAPNNYYVNYYTVITSDVKNKYVTVLPPDIKNYYYGVIVGTRAYDSQEAAIEGINDELNNDILPNLPTSCYSFISRVVYQTSSSYINSTKARVVNAEIDSDYTDLRPYKLNAKNKLINIRFDVVFTADTGWICGGIVAVNADNTKWDLTSDLKYSYLDRTDVCYPVRKTIVIPAQTGILADNLGISPVTALYADGAGNIIQSPVTALGILTDKLFFGFLIHIFSPFIEAVDNTVLPVAHTAQVAFIDFCLSMGPLDLFGNTISAGGANNSILKSEGYYALYNNQAKYNRYVSNTVFSSSIPAATTHKGVWLNNVGMSMFTNPSTLIKPLTAANWADNEIVSNWINLNGSSTTLTRVTPSPQSYYVNIPIIEIVNSHTLYFQFGQKLYLSLNDAKAGAVSWVKNPFFMGGVGSLLAVISIRCDQENLTAALVATPAPLAYITAGVYWGYQSIGASGTGGGGGGGYIQPPRIQALFVGKHGNDLNSGTQPDLPVLTLGEAITKANAAITKPVVINCEDDGSYSISANQVLNEGTYIYTPNAPINGGSLYYLALNNNTGIVCKSFTGNIRKVGTGRAFAHVESISATGVPPWYVAGGELDVTNTYTYGSNNAFDVVAGATLSLKTSYLSGNRSVASGGNLFLDCDYVASGGDYYPANLQNENINLNIKNAYSTLVNCQYSKTSASIEKSLTVGYSANFTDILDSKVPLRNKMYLVTAAGTSYNVGEADSGSIFTNNDKVTAIDYVIQSVTASANKNRLIVKFVILEPYPINIKLLSTQSFKIFDGEIITNPDYITSNRIGSTITIAAIDDYAQVLDLTGNWVFYDSSSPTVTNEVLWLPKPDGVMDTVVLGGNNYTIQAGDIGGTRVLNAPFIDNTLTFPLSAETIPIGASGKIISVGNPFILAGESTAIVYWRTYNSSTYDIKTINGYPTLTWYRISSAVYVVTGDLEIL